MAVGAVGAVGAIVSSNIQANATNRATRAYEKAAKRANDTTYEMWEQSRADFEPYLQAGYIGIQELVDNMPTLLQNLVVPYMQDYMNYQLTPAPDPTNYMIDPITGAVSGAGGVASNPAYVNTYANQYQQGMNRPQGLQQVGSAQAASTSQGGYLQQVGQAPQGQAPQGSINLGGRSGGGGPSINTQNTTGVQLGNVKDERARSNQTHGAVSENRSIASYLPNIANIISPQIANLNDPYNAQHDRLGRSISFDGWAPYEDSKNLRQDVANAVNTGLAQYQDQFAQGIDDYMEQQIFTRPQVTFNRPNTSGMSLSNTPGLLALYRAPQLA